MIPSLFLSLVLTSGVDVFGGARNEPLGPKAYPSIYVPAEAPCGYLYQPAVDLTIVPRLPAVKYCPKPGDILLLSDPDTLFNVLYVIAKSGKPGHCAIVVTMPDGRLGMLETGFSFTPWARLTPLDYAINLYAGNIWVRPREVPLTPEEDQRLTDFAVQANGLPYNKKRFANQLTLFRSRNPIVTRFAGKPIGAGQSYTCVQIVMEALVYTGLIDAITARPAATYAQDLFYDRSRNPYIDRHPPIAGRGWGPPQLWTPIPGSTLKGRDRPQPPAAWPGEGAAVIVTPIPLDSINPPIPTVVDSTPGDPSAMPAGSKPSRIGFFDRPNRIFSLKRQ